VTRVLIATKNAGKLVELRRIFDLPGLELIGVDELDASIPDVDEDRDTLEGNAIKKASELAARTGLPTLADDSGLEVDAIGGAPGVHSARYSGGGPAANVTKLLAALADVPDERRTARFRCVLAFIDPSAGAEPIAVTSGACDGWITRERRGTGGFGYDPILVPAGRDETMAEIGDDEKDRLSHRGMACRAMRPVLEAWLVRAEAERSGT
jgi:XTP/dITP diphosphohydrolase